MVVGLRFLFSLPLCSGAMVAGFVVDWFWFGLVIENLVFFFFFVGVLDFCGFWFVFLVLGLLWGGRWRMVTIPHRRDMMKMSLWD